MRILFLGFDIEGYGGIDILITCAGGYTRLAQVEDMPLDEWDRTKKPPRQAAWVHEEEFA